MKIEIMDNQMLIYPKFYENAKKNNGPKNTKCRNFFYELDYLELNNQADDKVFYKKELKRLRVSQLKRIIPTVGVCSGVGVAAALGVSGTAVVSSFFGAITFLKKIITPGINNFVPQPREYPMSSVELEAWLGWWGPAGNKLIHKLILKKIDRIDAKLDAFNIEKSYLQGLESEFTNLYAEANGRCEKTINQMSEKEKTEGIKKIDLIINKFLSYKRKLEIDQLSLRIT